MIASDLKTALGELGRALAERPSLDWPAFQVPADRLPEVVKALRDDQGYDMLVDVAGIDNGVEAAPRFTVAYHLFSTSRAAYVRLAADCPDSEKPSVPSLCALCPAANWHEREAYDMFGIAFEGHPDLRRILMWDGYPHHPLRKEFPLAGFEAELGDEEVAAATGAKVKPAAMDGGPFVAPQQGFMSRREPRAKDESWSDRKEKPET